jgi:hypothetical protein
MATAAPAPVTVIRYMHLKPTSTHSDPEFTALWEDVFAWLKTNSVEAQLWQNLSIPHSLVLISGWPSHDFRSTSFDSSKEKEYGEKLGKFLDSKNYQELKVDMKTLPLQAPILSIETFNVAAHDAEVFERKALDAQARVSEKTEAIAVVGGWDVFQEMQQPAPAPASTATSAAPPATSTKPTTETASSTAASAPAAPEKSNLTGDVLESLGDAGKGAIPVTGDAPGTSSAAAPVTGPTGGAPEFRVWVSITGWADEEQHVESAKEITGGQLESPREKVEATKNIYETLHLKKLM